MRAIRNLIALTFWLVTAEACAQDNSPRTQPYASIDRAAINYSGPDREASRDLGGPEIKIGLIAPLQGARKLEGDALVAAAQMAIEDESASPLADGQHLALVARDETGLWGRASSEIVKLVVEDRAVALVTSSDGRAAHLSEQVGNRLGVPVVTLATDATTTQINIPWLFRIVANDAVQAREFAENIYRGRAFRRVLLISESDHDGRAGAEEFEKAAQRLRAPAPMRIAIALPLEDTVPIMNKIRVLEPQALVLWTSAVTATHLLEGISGARGEIYLCRKALEEPFLSVARGKRNIWTVAPAVASAGSERAAFIDRFRARTGSAPSLAAAEVYDAVRLIAQGLRQSGPNRARLRDALATRTEYHGVSGIIAFDGAGNNRAEVSLVQLQ
ncbi:MAG: ABC transporter substrate-binding protein [Acidobacteria bacterium]|nr:ABC transporter substrate-binding protein [Acidobacteriota bacterium]